MALPIGLFGGAFDPVHFGHLRLATELREAFGLERVVFLPTGQPWQRGRATFASGEARIAMLELATAQEPAFVVDAREVRRPGPTYSIDTLAELRAEAGPDVPLVFLLGTDAFAKLDTWHRWESLFDFAHFAVAVRADDDAWQARGPESMPATVRARMTTELDEILTHPAGAIMTFAMTPVAISSTAIRAKVGSRASVRYLTPDPVARYIQSHSLYGNPA